MFARFSSKRVWADMKNAPLSHLLAFGLLHEITAILPLPIAYYSLKYSELPYPIPDHLLDEANRRINKLISYSGWDTDLINDRHFMLNCLGAYAIVKAAMPLRIAISLAGTPYLASVFRKPIAIFSKYKS
ncbi:hypothetical protein BC833DRAFT_591112 [Globomyces pollinis-pini]|nr:hypothetical protein BC833DRAFT_591112 [Globomyces pollinis-pini]